MKTMRKSLRILLFSGLAAGTALFGHAEVPESATATAAAAPQSAPVRGSDVTPADDARWNDTFAAFAAADRAHAPAPGGVVFVGSSSIRLWNGLETAFQDNPVIVKRGFGGSRLVDCVRHLGQLVTSYKPRVVVVYAGDNDLAEGRSPQQVLQSFTRLVEGVHKDLPQTRIAFVSVKPSPLRIALLDKIREANALIQAYAQTAPDVDFIDVFSGMVDAQGQPRTELFLPDRLHLNAAGYALWRQAIGPHLH